MDRCKTIFQRTKPRMLYDCHLLDLEYEQEREAPLLARWNPEKVEDKKACLYGRSNRKEYIDHTTKVGNASTHSECIINVTVLPFLEPLE